MSKKKVKHHNRHGKKQFAQLDYGMLESEAFANLSPYALKLFMSLLPQYNGFNNGALILSWRLMKKRGWVSNSALYKARDELIRDGWLIITRQGGERSMTLYAVTTYPLSEDVKKKFDSKIEITNAPLNTWKTQFKENPPVKLPSKFRGEPYKGRPKKLIELIKEQR